MSTPCTSSWYAIWVRSKSEKVTSAALRAKGYEEFLPLYRARHRWSDRAKELDLPLFPCYLFCRFDPSDRLMPILTTPGFVHIVAAGNTPLPIPDEEITAIRTIIGSGSSAEPWTFVNVGSRVRIERGPLAGIEGLVTNRGKKCRLIVSVALLQRSVAVEIEQDWVCPVLSPLAPRRPHQ
jgi:transcription antitermination factor NusG